MLILQNTGFNARKLGKFNKLYPAVKLYITRHIFFNRGKRDLEIYMNFAALQQVLDMFKALT